MALEILLHNSGRCWSDLVADVKIFNHSTKEGQRLKRDVWCVKLTLTQGRFETQQSEAKRYKLQTQKRQS